MHSPCTRAAMGKTKEVAFSRLRTLLLLAFLEANIAFSQRHRRAPTPLLLPLPEAEPEQKAGPAQSAHVAPPQRIPGSACTRQESGWKGSAVGGFLKPGKEKSFRLSSYQLLTHSADERGRVQTSTRPPPAQTQTHALFSFAGSGRADISVWLLC